MATLRRGLITAQENVSRKLRDTQAVGFGTLGLEQTIVRFLQFVINQILVTAL